MLSPSWLAAMAFVYLPPPSWLSFCRCSAASNEFKSVLHSMDIDLWKIIDAAATQAFGFQPFYPGPGPGGHCIKIDSLYLTWKAREHDPSTHFIERAAEIITQLLDQGARVGYHDSHVTELSDMRRYPALSLHSAPLTIERLEQADCVLICTRPSCLEERLMGRHTSLLADTRNAMAHVPCETARVVRACPNLPTFALQ